VELTYVTYISDMWVQAIATRSTSCGVLFQKEVRGGGGGGGG